MRRLPTSVMAMSLLAMSLGGCLSKAPEGLKASPRAETTVKFDFEHRPLPEIPLPNDVATRYDPTSATTRRINASMIAPTGVESHVRQLLDQLDGWGLVQPITIPFTGPLDIQSIIDGHDDPDYNPVDDVIYLIDIDRDSPDFGKLQLLDVGNGNYPVGTEKRNEYWANDPRGDTISILFEEHDEDLNGNGVLDPGEDTDGDGVLDFPNYLPGRSPAKDDLTARADALMGFYERETNTLIVQPVVPLRERTTYAVVITRRLLDASGKPVGSPYPYINHASQTEALRPLIEVLPDTLPLNDVAFAFTFTTQTTTSEFIAVRDGLYGFGIQKHLSSEYPAQLGTIEQAKDAEILPGANVFILPGEQFASALRLLNLAFRGTDGNALALTQLLESNKYVDYYLIGSYESPQLFDRVDADGNPLRMNDQSWQPDLDRVPTSARSETVYFTLVVPRKEVSDRKDGKPAPVVVLGHGHTGNRFSAINLGPYFARHGLATIAIDNPGHGLGISDDEKTQAYDLLSAFGIGPFLDATFKDRAFDQNFDGRVDPGADYWDFYLFHTRDNVRQTALDYMQLIRIMRSFDGTRKMNFDVDGDGENDIAGDFDGDGVIDIGGDASITMTGGSLGGIMAMLMGSIEPEIDAIAPIVGGGGLGTIARRSFNGSVRRAIILRAMGPLFIGTPEADGSTRIETIIPNINESPGVLRIGTVQGVQPGDTMAMVNLVNGERECGRVDPNGLVRAPLACDLGDNIEVRFYRGDVQIGPKCVLEPSAEPYAVIDTFEQSLTFQDQSHEEGAPLLALAEGLGLRRSTPDFRRFVSLGQIVMDRADPSIYGRHLQLEPLTYPGTGQTTGAHALITTGIGDLNVPVDAGQLFARSAGILEWRKANPLYGVPDNQVLIDNYVLEGMDELKRFVAPDGHGVLIDPNNFSGDTDEWAGLVPRLDPPMRTGFDTDDPLGGRSANIFGYGSDRGRHGFDGPGEMTDNARKRCKDADGDDCNAVEIFDVGNFHYNMMAAYLKSKGKVLNPDLCHSRWDCTDILPVPEARTFSD